jgi:hypothetical protein
MSFITEENKIIIEKIKIRDSNLKWLLLNLNSAIEINEKSIEGIKKLIKQIERK